MGGGTAQRPRVDKISFCKNLSIIDVCRDVAGIEYTGKNTVSPFRGNSGSNAFSIDRKRNMFADWGYPVDNNPRGFASGDPIDFVAYYYGCTTKEAVDTLWKMYHGISSNRSAVQAQVTRSEPVRNEAPSLTREKLNLAYTAFLNFAPVEPKAEKYLKETRNMDDDEIRYFMFRSFPLANAREDITKTLKSLDIDPDSVPGLYTKKGENLVSFRRKDAILIPIYTVYECIEGLQLRFFDSKDGPRYIWFSSEKMGTDTCVHDGKSPGTPIGFVDRIIKNDRTLFITEGVFKAIALNKCYGCPAFSIQGVGNYCGIEEHVKTALKRYPKIERVVIAYDSDFIGNMSVSSHAIKLYKTLKKEIPELRYQYLFWDEAYGKGIDDLIEATGGWNVRSIVKTINMSDYEAAYEKVLPEGRKLMLEGDKEAIKELMRKSFSSFIK